MRTSCSRWSSRTPCPARRSWDQRIHTSVNGCQLPSAEATRATCKARSADIQNRVHNRQVDMADVAPLARQNRLDAAVLRLSVISFLFRISQTLALVLTG